MRLAFLRPNTSPQVQDPASPAKQSHGGTIRFILALMLFAWALRSFVTAPFSIPSGSMLPALYIGDYLVVAKWPYGYSTYSFPFGFPSFHGRVFGHLPERGDVVVFRHPTENADWIKRVIGVPGDTVEVRAGQVILNGRPVPRQALPTYKLAVSANSPCRSVQPEPPVEAQVRGQTYCLLPAFRETLPGGPSYTVLDQATTAAEDFAPTKVPPGHVFLMGDNRDDSLDSRFTTEVGGIGMVPVDNLIGRAEFTFWSTDGGASWWKPWTWYSALRASRLGNTYSGDAK
jgi:signal peptidase I